MGLAFRVIARLDVKGENVIKGINFEGLRVIGKPNDFARRYADQGADEIIFIDSVASLYGRNHLEETLTKAAAEVFIPIAAGGGIRSKEDARRLFNAGADKVMVNTAALERPSLIDELARYFGSQAVVVSIEVKRINGSGWHAYANCGRDSSGRDALAWAAEAAARGAGEILLTSIDRDGTQAGPDVSLRLCEMVDIPVILGGGITLSSVAQAAQVADAIAIGAALHYGKTTIAEVKAAIAKTGKEVRL